MPKITKKPKPKKVAAERATSKATSQAMASRGTLIGTLGPQSAIWQNNAVVKQAGLEAVAAAAAVGQDDDAISKMEIQIGAARNLKVDHEVTCCSKLDVYFTSVEDNVTTPTEMQGLGVDPAVDHAYTLAIPLGLTAKSDPALHNIAVIVKRAPGMRRCVIEMSADLTMATGVKPFPGDGARQSMGPLTPGTYAVRACHTRASERSAYTDIVTVVVK